MIGAREVALMKEASFVYFILLRARGPHWGTVRKKMSPGKVYVLKSRVLPYTNICNDYTIIFEVAQQE